MSELRVPLPRLGAPVFGALAPLRPVGGEMGRISEAVSGLGGEVSRADEELAALDEDVCGAWKAVPGPETLVAAVENRRCGARRTGAPRRAPLERR